jgi:hypothetical protein
VEHVLGGVTFIGALYLLLTMWSKVVMSCWQVAVNFGNGTKGQASVPVERVEDELSGTAPSAKSSGSTKTPEQPPTGSSPKALLCALWKAPAALWDAILEHRKD